MVAARIQRGALSGGRRGLRRRCQIKRAASGARPLVGRADAEALELLPDRLRVVEDVDQIVERLVELLQVGGEGPRCRAQLERADLLKLEPRARTWRARPSSRRL
jgi:hypothetical protein